MTGSGKTGLCINLPEEANSTISRRSSRPQRRHYQPAARLPRPAPRRFRAVGQRGRRPAHGCATLPPTPPAAGKKGCPVGVSSLTVAARWLKQAARYSIATPPARWSLVSILAARAPVGGWDSDVEGTVEEINGSPAAGARGLMFNPWDKEHVLVATSSNTRAARAGFNPAGSSCRCRSRLRQIRRLPLNDYIAEKSSAVKLALDLNKYQARRAFLPVG